MPLFGCFNFLACFSSSCNQFNSLFPHFPLQDYLCLVSVQLVLCKIYQPSNFDVDIMGVKYTP